MAKRHDPNLNPEAQPWGRDVNTELDESLTRDESLAAENARLRAKLDEQATAIGLLGFELRKLYSATGNTYPPVAVPPVAVPVPPKLTNATFSADWSRTWGTSSFYTGSDTYTNGTYLYQGSNPENKVGMWHFPTASIIGKQIVSASLYLSNINTPWQPVVTAHFGTHGNDTAPTGKPGRVNPFDVGWSRGEAKWHPLDVWVLNGLSNGSIKGFTVGASGASDADSAFWAGVGTGAPPQLSVDYYA